MYGHGLSEPRLGAALRWYPRDEYVALDQGRPAPERRPRARRSTSRPGSTACRSGCASTTPTTVRCARSRTACSGWAWSGSTSPSSTTATCSPTAEQPSAAFREAMDGACRASSSCAREGVVERDRRRRQRVARSAEALQASATSTASCSPAATPCSSRKRSTSSCRSARSAVPPWSWAAATTAGSWRPAPSPGAKYNYGPAPAAIMERTRRIEAVCASAWRAAQGGGVAVRSGPPRDPDQHPRHADGGADGRISPCSAPKCPRCSGPTSSARA